MLYRAFLLCVAGFFVAMWALLIRSEVRPGGAGIRSLPAEHVWREVFRHEQSSDLWVYDGRNRLGHLRLRPQAEDANGQRQLGFSGNLQLTLPGAPLQRVAWEGELKINRATALDFVRLATTTREIAAQKGGGEARINPAVQLELRITPPTRRASYEVRMGDQVTDEQNFTLDEEGIRELAEHLGLDPAWQRQLGAGQAPRTEVTARQSSLEVHGVTMETYLVTVMVNEQTLVEAQISQLGEILEAKTLLGWTLRQE